MGSALVKLDEVAMPSHPLTGWGNFLADYASVAETPEAEQLRRTISEAGGKWAVEQERKRQYERDGWLGRVFKTNEKEEAERLQRERAGESTQVLIQGLLWIGEWGGKKYAAHREQLTIRKMVWDVLRFAAHDKTRTIPLALEHQLVAVMHRLGASKGEILSLASTAVPTRATELQHFPAGTPQGIQHAVARISAFAVTFNQSDPGAVGKRDLRRFLRDVVSAPPELVTNTVELTDASYDGTLDDLGDLAIEATRKVVQAASVIRTRLPKLDLDRITTVAQRAAAYDPRKETRDKLWVGATEAIRAGAPLLIGAATAAWAGPAAAIGAHGVAQAMVTGVFAPKELKAVVAELERGVVDGWKAEVVRETRRPPVVTGSNRRKGSR